MDVEGGSTGGVVPGNQLDGLLITGANSWVDVKGNAWTVSANVGRHSPLDGFHTHEVRRRVGTGNTFTGNSGELDAGEGFLVAPRPARDGVAGCGSTLLSAVGGGLRGVCARLTAALGECRSWDRARTGG